MRKNEPTINQVLAQKQYYKDLAEDLIQYILYNYSEDRLLKHLIRRGYSKNDLVHELYFDEETVDQTIQEVFPKYYKKEHLL
jgi:hypothetical protein